MTRAIHYTWAQLRLGMGTALNYNTTVVRIHYGSPAADHTNHAHLPQLWSRALLNSGELINFDELWMHDCALRKHTHTHTHYI